MDGPPRKQTPSSAALPGSAPPASDEEVPAAPAEGPTENDLGATRVVGEPKSEPETALVLGKATALAAAGGLSITSHLGDYRLLGKLGQGAMAAVYKARQSNPARDVALKVLFKHIADTPKLLERFYREARVLGRLEHPNIVRGYGVGQQNDLHYFAMEYVDGQSLQSWLLRLGRLSVGDAVHVTLACARALEYAHGIEVIHRDIKPDNVLITQTGVVKVADLGMVKMLDEDMGLTQTGHAVGTPWYMPLEQARNSKDTDGRCDIYALGCMLYHMLVGRPPFVGPTLVDLIREKQVGSFAAARQSNPEVTERLDLVIAKMAAKLVRHRYQSCAEVIKDLEALELASPALTFLQPPEAAKPPAAAPAPRTAYPTMQAELTDQWQVRYKKANGQAVQRQLRTDEVLRLIEAGQLGPTARATRRGKEGYRALGTYREFQPAVLGQAARTGADRRTARHRSLYSKIEEQDRQRDSQESEAATAGSLHYWLGLGWKFGLPAAGIVAGLVLLRWLVLVIQ